MPNSIARSETITKLRYAADLAFAMLAGMQLDGFLQRIVGGRVQVVRLDQRGSTHLVPSKLRKTRDAPFCTETA